MILRSLFLSLCLTGIAAASGFSEQAGARAEQARIADPELAEWVSSVAPTRNRAGQYYFPGRTLVQEHAQALLMERLLSKQDDTEVRVALAYALDSSVLIPWSRVSEEEDPRVRAAMIHLSKESTQPGAAELLASATTDPAPGVRAEALRISGYVQRAPQLDRALLRALKDSEPQARALAARSLGWLQVQTAFDAIRPLLADENPEVRDRALQALADINESRTRGLDELLVLQEDSHRPLARRAQRLLK